MSRLQLVVIGVACLLFVFLYFGASTTPREQLSVNQQRAQKAASVTPGKLLIQARQMAKPQQLAFISTLEMQLDSAETVDDEIIVLKEMSGAWYGFGFPALSASYAEEIAVLQPSDSAWSIAGATYFTASRFNPDEKVREHCIGKAISAFENAISLNPDNPEYRVNLGLCYVEGSGEPMKGILMIRDLLEDYPDNVLVLYTLGRLSLESGQIDKAIERLEKVISIEPGNIQANLLLSRCLETSGNILGAVEVLESALKLADHTENRAQLENRLKELKK